MRTLKRACLKPEGIRRQDVRTIQAQAYKPTHEFSKRHVASASARRDGQVSGLGPKQAERLSCIASNRSCTASDDRLLLSKFWIPSINARRPDNLQKRTLIYVFMRADAA